MSAGFQTVIDAADRLAAVMDRETEALAAGGGAPDPAVVRAKSDLLRALETAFATDAGAAAGDGLGRPFAAAVRRLLTSAERNRRGLNAALAGTRRVLACLSEAANDAASVGLYGRDGRPRAGHASGIVDRSA